MKKILLALAVIIVLVVGAGVFVYLNLDSLVKSAIETAGTDALGTEVSVDEVTLDLPAGRASVYGFRIANPTGYTRGDMIRVAELSVGLDVMNLSAESIHVTSVVSRDPYVLYEMRDGTANFDVIAARFDSGEPAEPEGNPSAQPRIIVDSILIRNISGTLMDDRLPASVDVNLGDIELANLDGTPTDLASQIMAPVIAQVGRRAAAALVRTVSQLLSNPGELQNRVEEGRQRLEDAAGEALNRVGNLFRGGDDEEN